MGTDVNFLNGTVVTPEWLNETNNHKENKNYDHLEALTDTGAANAYVVAFPHAPTAYQEGIVVVFKAAHANTGASTLNCNGLGALAIQLEDGSELPAGFIQANALVPVIHNGTCFQLISPGLAAHLAETVTYSGTLSRSSDVTTNLDVNVGFKPKWVQIQSTGDTGQYSNGQQAQTGASCMFRKPGGIITVHNGYISRLSNDGGTQVVQIACTFTDTGFTLSFESYSYPVTTLNMCYIAGTH